MDLSSIKTQNIHAEWLTNKQVLLDVLRLDEIDDVVSGNKWFKLKYFLREAGSSSMSTIATFGGAWSNHIIATAYAAREAGLKSVGIIRGEKPASISQTLLLAMEYGMELHFVTREQYRKKEEIKANFSHEDWYWIDEGGHGIQGVKGASEILQCTNTTSYNHIVAAVGTGTMLAGLIVGSVASQKVTGISSMKGNYEIEQKIVDLIAPFNIKASYDIKQQYHFGGYGKHPEALISFINEIYYQHHLPLDIIYTGKTFFAIKDMVETDQFKPGDKVLMIHSGGLQGNKSLPEKVLTF